MAPIAYGSAPRRRTRRTGRPSGDATVTGVQTTSEANGPNGAPRPGPQRVGRYVRMVSLPGHGGELAQALLRVADGMADAPGCQAYVVNAAPDEPDTVWVTEVWADAASSEEALNRDLGEAGLGAVLELLAEAPEYIEVSPLGGPGLGRS